MFVLGFKNQVSSFQEWLCWLSRQISKKQTGWSQFEDSVLGGWIERRTGNRIDGCPTWCKLMRPLFFFLCDILSSHPVKFAASQSVAFIFLPSALYSFFLRPQEKSTYQRRTDQAKKRSKMRVFMKICSTLAEMLSHIRHLLWTLSKFQSFIQNLTPSLEVEGYVSGSTGSGSRCRKWKRRRWRWESTKRKEVQGVMELSAQDEGSGVIIQVN